MKNIFCVWRCVPVLLILFKLLMAVPAEAKDIRKDSVLTMPFGKNNYIRYALERGIYDVYVNGKLKVRNVHAQYNGPDSGDSRTLVFNDCTITPLRDAFGKGKLFVVNRGSGKNMMQQLFYVYPGKDYFFVQVNKRALNAGVNYSAPFSGATVIAPQGEDRRGLFVPFDNDMWVRYNACTLEGADYTSSEATALYSNGSREGMVIGSIEHEVWKSGVQVKHLSGNEVAVTAFGGYTDSITTHDRNPHGIVGAKDSVARSPKIMVGFFSDWREGMEAYARLNRLAEPPVVFKWKKATPMGWNSWGAIQTNISLDNAKKVVDFFADSCKTFRNADSTLYIDIDSYWDNLTGGMTGDFSALAAFSAYCKQKGLQPGIYWAPFADWNKTPRKMETGPYRYEETWLKAKGAPMDIDGARAMDPTHPGTQQRMAYLLNRFKKAGFTMVKVDFLGHGALEADRFADPAVTTGMQAYKVGMAFMDSVLDGAMLLYAAISPNMATARYVHMRRVGCDAFSAIDNTEYTLNSTGYGWWQSSLYDFIDGDHVVFGKEKAGANRARLASAMVTGTLITGDDFSQQGQWTTVAKNLLQQNDLLRIMEDGKSFRPVEANTGNKGVELFVKKQAGDIYIAAFSFGKEKKTFRFPPERIGLKKGRHLVLHSLFSGALVPFSSEISFDVLPEDAAIYQIIQRN
ncbi:MAG: alpha-galactosidase [Chitinophagaceae bacterium]